MKKSIHSVLMLLLTLLFIGCNIPKDPNETYEKAKKSSLKVGIVPLGDSILKQKEKEFITDFANEESMEVQFTSVNETEMVKKIEEYELDMGLGGFEKKTNWKSKVGMSKPYDGTHVIFIPRGENRLLSHLENFIKKNRKKWN